MITFQTILVYIIFFIIFFLLLNKAKLTNSFIYCIAGCLLFSLLAGFRYGVGMDYFPYLEGYEYLKETGHFIGNHEIGFQFLSKILAECNLSSTVFFAVIGFIQMLFICLAIRKDRYIFPFFAFVFVFACTWLIYFNGLRQVISFCIWTYSIRFIVSKDVVKHYLLLLLALSFHNSALMLIIFYPIFNIRTEWFKNIKYQLIALCISLILMKINYIQNLIEVMENLLELTGYDIYTSDRFGSQLIRESTITLGGGFYLSLLIYVICILYSNKVKRYLNNDYFNIIYDLFFIGVLIKNVFVNSILMTRINYYFICFDVLVASFVLFYLLKRNKKIFLGLFFLHVIMFIGVMSKMDVNTVSYIFNFQDDLFYLKQYFRFLY